MHPIIALLLLAGIIALSAVLFSFVLTLVIAALIAGATITIGLRLYAKYTVWKQNKHPHTQEGDMETHNNTVHDVEYEIIDDVKEQ